MQEPLKGVDRARQVVELLNCTAAGRQESQGRECNIDHQKKESSTYLQSAHHKQ